MMPPASTTLAEEHVASDEQGAIRAFITFLEAASRTRHRAGPVRRFNQGRHSGCVEAEFTVLDTLPADCRVGLFAASRTYAAWIRFASAVSASDREKDVRGMSIKLRDVDGDNLTPGSHEQDFILNSHPVMPVPDTPSFLELLRAVEAGGVRRALYFLRRPRAARIVLASRQHHASHLDIPYWSTTPYLFGPGRAVKYSVRPVAGPTSRLPEPLADDYLRRDLATRLAAPASDEIGATGTRHDDGAAFDFLIQFQTDAATMPIEDASVDWPERASPPVAVARIRVPPQQIDTPERDRACEDTAFNPWHALVEHRPLGSMNRARREIYAAMAALRASSIGR